MVLALACGGGRVGNANVRLDVAPASLDFGVGPIGQRTVRTVTGAAIGTSRLRIERLEVTGESSESFVIDEPRASGLRAGEETSLVIAFQPSTSGVKHATLVLSTDSPITPEVLVPLVGIAQPLERCEPPCHVTGADGGLPSVDAGLLPGGDAGRPPGIDAGTLSRLDAGVDAGRPDAGPTGACNGNGVCEPNERCTTCTDCEGPARAATLEVTPAAAAFGFSSPRSCATELVLLSVYQPNGGPIAVTVSRSTPMVLALSSYSMARWSVDAGANVLGIIVTGYDPQTLAAPASIPVVNRSPHQTGWLGCGYSWPYNGGGCDTDALIRALEQQTGLRVSHFAGAYGASGFEVR